MDSLTPRNTNLAVDFAIDFKFGLFSSALTAPLGDPSCLLCFLLKTDRNRSERERSVLHKARSLDGSTGMKASTYLWILEPGGSKDSTSRKPRDGSQELASIPQIVERSDQHHLSLSLQWARRQSRSYLRFSFDDGFSVYGGDLGTPCCRLVDGGTIRDGLPRGIPL